MKNILHKLIILIIVMESCSKNEVSNGLIEINDIAYGSHPRQQLDIYLPKNRDKSMKVVLLIHGGGWLMGSKEDFYLEACYLAKHGFVSAAMNYRYAGNQTNVHYLQMMDDVRLAIQCILTKAPGLGFDNRGIALAGASAGGHLALLYSYGYDSLRKVRAVISMAGPADILAADLLAVPGMKNMLGIVVGDTDRTKWDNANPIYFVSTNSTPSCFFHGVPDNVVPYTQSVKLHEALNNAGVPNEIYLFDGSGHGFSDPDLKTVLEKSSLFLRKYF